MASGLLYRVAKDMRNSFKFGTGRAKQMLPILLLLVGAVNPLRLHAEEKRSAVATLRLQVVVMPTVIAAQLTRRPDIQPSHTPISFNFSPNNTQNGNYSTHEVTVPGENGSPQTAVLKTLTVVPE